MSWDDYGELFIASFFGENDQPIEATFDANGNWNETITIMEEEDLPETITNYISKKYSEDSEIVKISFSEKPTDIFYFVSIEVSPDDEDIESETWVLTFNKGGKFLEKE